MKLNWGNGIAIFYGCFMVAMILMVIKSCNNQSHLVEEEYYQKDLSYEDFRIKRANGNAMTDQVVVNYNRSSKLLELSFPSDMNSPAGELILYRPSNKYLDKVFKLKLDSMNMMAIPIGKEFAKGLWKIQLDWESNSIPYYTEINFTI